MTAEQAINMAIDRCDVFIELNTSLFHSLKGNTEAKIVSAKLVAYKAVKLQLAVILNEIKNEQI